MSTSNHAPELQTPLLSVDHKGRPVYRSNSGGWRSAGFILGVDVAERFAYYGISSNLITYLTGPLGQSTATAAENVNMWAATATLLPILGAFVADSFLGRYTAIIVASLIYILSQLGSLYGFGIPCAAMVISLVIFLLGTKMYRYSVKLDKNSAFLRIGSVFVSSIRNWRATPSAIALEEEARGTLPHPSSEQYMFLNKACHCFGQRIGTGIFLSVATMVIAALVEMKRLKTAQEHGLVDLPDVTIPMSVWWLIPQYVLFGIAQSFTMVALQEFFYDQVPSDLRSVGISLKFSIFGAGNFLSSFLISVIEKATSGNGRYSWFDNNLNRTHLDYFYWLLAGMSVVQMAFYVYSAKSYIYNRRGAV
uniref:Protein NRT1/ PTR FAMILY 5.10-like isoform X1 n=1 Tax=Populus alba TaxID=43335 RepID=A0A4U5QEV2_POPAL|nr:protein NRT1/ PTR FAMILY 5.10-like isoform X1 [Populus alba]